MPLYILGFSLLTVSPAALFAGDFDLAPPAQYRESLRLWSTRYYKYFADRVRGAGAVALRNRNGVDVGVAVSPKDFCFGALQGTIAIRDGDTTSVWNAAGTASVVSTTCSYPSLKPKVNAGLSRQAWVRVTGNGQLGLGVGGMRLVAFRTIAVDRTRIPIGTVLYIPALRGWEFGDGGATHRHDGYVIAGDVGGGIKDRHVDFFTGIYTGAPPPFVTSRAQDMTGAMIVSDAGIVARLRQEARYVP